MIYTVTFNPSLDYAMNFHQIKQGALNRAVSAAISAGGKGINVSRILTQLNIDNQILGFIAGFTGDEIERELKENGYSTDFIRLEKGVSRINVKVSSEGITELNAPGPEISKNSLEALYAQLDRLNEGDFLVLAGNIPEGMPDFTYSLILERMNRRGVNSIVDASGNVLLSTLNFAPFLIKPNRQELEELFSTTIPNHESSIRYIRELQNKGARNVLVSLDHEGAVLGCENSDILYMPAPEGNINNTVGAGDSMVAGFIWGYLEKGNYEDALECSISAGSAAVFSPGMPSGDDIRALRRLLRKC